MQEGDHGRNRGRSGRLDRPRQTGSKNTLSILKGEGFVWNGDDASDDLPFLRDTDHGPMVIMPRTNTPQNDLTMWLAPRNPPSVLWDGFKNTFDTLYAEGEAGKPKVDGDHAPLPHRRPPDAAADH